MGRLIHNASRFFEDEMYHTQASLRKYNSYDRSPYMQRLLAHDRVYSVHPLHGVTHISSEYYPVPETLCLWSLD